MKMYILLCNKWLIFKIKFIIHSLCIECVYSICAFDVVHLISMGVFFACNIFNGSKEISLNCEQKQRRTNEEQKKRVAHAQTHTHKSNGQEYTRKCAWHISHVSGGRYIMAGVCNQHRARCEVRKTAYCVLCVSVEREMFFGG